MTKFIPVSGSHIEDRIYVNASLITKMVSEPSGGTIIHFDKDNSVATKTPVMEIVSAIETTAPD